MFPCDDTLHKLGSMVVLLLLIHCLLTVAGIFMRVLCLVFVLLCNILCPSSFATIQPGRKERGLFDLYCLLDVMLLLLFCGSSSLCRELVCGVSLWHFLVIFTFYFNSHYQ